jgi:hypothetical protein
MVTGMIWLGAMPAAAMYTVALPAGCQLSGLDWETAATTQLQEPPLPNALNQRHDI